MALWGKIDNVTSVGTVSLNYDTKVVTGTLTQFGAVGSAKTGDIIRFGVRDGGGTYFENYDRTIDAVEGRCVIWPAYWTHFHNGVVSNTQTKYIATGWYMFHEYQLSKKKIDI